MGIWENHLPNFRKVVFLVFVLTIVQYAVHIGNQPIFFNACFSSAHDNRSELHGFLVGKGRLGFEETRCH